MVHDTRAFSEPRALSASDQIEMPRTTIAPLTLSLGVAMVAMGIITSPAFLMVGVAIAIVGLGLWISSLLPGRGHLHEPLVPVDQRPRTITSRPETVTHLVRGMPGYRLRLPTEVHPISAGVRGGIVGGIVMPIPALAYGIISGHGIWYPVNLLAGMVLPGIGQPTRTALDEFHLSFLLLGIFIHVVLSVVLGLIYGVLLPTLPLYRNPWPGGAS